MTDYSFPLNEDDLDSELYEQIKHMSQNQINDFLDNYNLFMKNQDKSNISIDMNKELKNIKSRLD